jgi:putative membrane protein
LSGGIDKVPPFCFMRFIKQLSWVLRALLFLVIFGFALMNTDMVRLRFFLGQVWEMPMIIALLLFFAFGAAIGVLACVSRLLGQRREIQKLRRELRPRADRAVPPPA